MSRHTTERINRTSRPAERNINPSPEQVKARAYELWLERGCPMGSDQEDWYRAEAELRNAGESVQRAA